ncbi:MAG TPA: hypothetical protein VIL72_01180 [Beijerinckiaceae bacterium]|jgi:hypothetical protein
MNRMIHLVGSVPLASAAEVFTAASRAFGARLRQIPDGETGERLDWITHLETLFSENPAFEPSPETFAVHAGSKRRTRYRLAPGVAAQDVRFGDLGYARHARESWAAFRRLKDEGVVGRDVRFQVDLVPAHSILWLFVVEEQQRALDPVFNAHVKAEMAEIFEAIPAQELAVQFDVASAVFARLERNEPTPYGATRAEMVDTFAAIVADLADATPDAARLMFHFCYGDANHKHAIEPTDMNDMTLMANALASRIRRRIDLIHMPVPRERDDDAYFAPLQDLRLAPETEISLGLLHYTDGLEGAKRRMAAADKRLRSYSIATECGFGRRDPATLPALMRLHVEAAELTT